MQNSTIGRLKTGTHKIFFILVLSIFPLYVYHNPVRWDAIYYNFSSFFYIFRPYTLFGHLSDLVLITLFILCGHLVGWALQSFFSSRSLNLAVTVPIGWGLIALFVFFMALLQLLSPAYLLLLLLLLTAASLIRLLFLYRDKSLSLNHLKSYFSRANLPQNRVALLLLLIPLFYAFLSSLMPPTQSDGLRYHLSVPKLYLQHGGFYIIENIAFSNFPFIIEYLYTIPLAFGSTSGPKLIHCSFFYFTLLLIYQQGKALGGRSVALYAALILATIPFVPIFASWSFIEFGLTCYTVLACTFLLRYFESINKSDTYSSLFGLGLSLGFLLGCKYTALATVGFFCMAAFIFAYRKYNLTTACLHILFLTLVFTVIASPWYIKNALLLDNPLYPFASSLFPTPHWSEFNTAFFSYHASIKGHLNAVQQSPLLSQLTDLISLPFRLTFFPGEPWHQPEYFGAWPVGMLGLTLFPLLIFLRGWSLRMILPILLSVALFLIWAYTYRDTRFLLPSIALAAPVLGLLIQRLDDIRKLSRFLVYVMMLYALLWTTGLMLLYRTHDIKGNPSPWGKYDPWLVVSGEVSESRYLEEFNEFTRHNNQAFRYLAENTDPTQTVLLHGIHHPFYCPNDFVGADWFNTDPLLQWSWDCNSLAELIHKLQSENIHYIVYNFGEVHRSGYFQYYRLFRLPQDVALPLLQEKIDKEPMRINYPQMYRQVFLPRYQEKLTTLENEHTSVALVDELLNGHLLQEVFRFELDPEENTEGIRILKVPTSNEKNPAR